MDSSNVYVSDKTTDDTDTQLVSVGFRKVRDLPLLEKKEFIKKMTYFWLLQAKIEIIAYEVVKAIGPARDFMAFDIGAFYFWFAPIITILLFTAVYFEQWRYKPYSYYILILYPISYAITLMQLHGIILYNDEDKHFDYRVADIFSAILTSCFPALLSIIITLRRQEGFKLKLKTLIPIACLLFVIFRLIAYVLQRPGKNTQYYLSIVFGFIFSIAYLCIYLRGVKRVIKGHIRMNEAQDVASPMILFIHLVS